MKQLNKMEKELCRLEFEDKYNPMKVYAYLRFGFEFSRERARELSKWYEDVFYKVIIHEYDGNKNKLESDSGSHSRHSYP